MSMKTAQFYRFDGLRDMNSGMRSEVKKNFSRMARRANKKMLMEELNDHVLNIEEDIIKDRQMYDWVLDFYIPMVVDMDYFEDEWETLNLPETNMDFFEDEWEGYLTPFVADEDYPALPKDEDILFDTDGNVYF